MELCTRILDEAQLGIAGALIRRDGLVVFPTETVYGLGANALSETAVAGIFRAKGRPQDNPLIVHVASLSQITEVADSVNDIARVLIENLMPGPLTVILPRAAGLARGVTAGKDTVGLRIPGSELARRFLAEAGVPVAAPSANQSGRPSPTSFAMALAEMDGRVDAVIRGPDATVGLESTIVWPQDERTVHLLRPGGIDALALRGVLDRNGMGAARLLFNGQEIGAAVPRNHGRVSPISAGSAGSGGENSVPFELPAAPGTRYRHYSPKAMVRLFSDRADLQALLAAGAAGDAPAGGGGVALIGAELCPGYQPPAGLGGDWSVAYRSAFVSLDDYAHHLYRELVEADHRGNAVVLAWLPPAAGIGLALRDRLERAAGKTG